MIYSVKFFVILFNTLFWVSGLALVIVGAMSRPMYTEVESVSHMSQGLSHTSILLIVVGIIISLLSFVGAIGAWADDRLLLGLFTGFLMLIFSLQIVCGILFYVFRSQVERKITTKTKEVIMKHSAGDMPAINEIQHAFHCCGAESYTDWLQDSHGNISAVPHSCCHIDAAACLQVVTTDNIYQRGCVSVIKEYLKRNLVGLGATCIVLGLMAFAGSIMGMKLFQDIKRREVYETFG